MSYTDPNARVLTNDEAEAIFAERAKRRADRLAAKARRANLAPMLAAERERRGPRPTERMVALAVGESVTLPGYKSTTQTSSAMRNAYIKTGFRFTSKLARSPDLLTGETEIVTGVTVTRTE